MKIRLPVLNLMSDDGGIWYKSLTIQAPNVDVRKSTGNPVKY